MFNEISEKDLERLRQQYPKGTRVELISMNDPYNKKLVPGSKGTIQFVDDVGTAFVAWDCGSSLGLVYNEDSYKIIEE